MKIFVISLKSASQRRKKIEPQMAAQALPFEFFDAIRGQSEQQPILHAHCSKRRFSRKGYPLKEGELGCFASHYLLWEKCVHLNKPIVILEDDVQLNAEFKNILGYVEKHIHQLGLVRLSRTLKPTFIKISDFIHSPSLDKSMLVRYTKPAKGGMGYILSPVAAKKLINNAKNWYDPVDDFLEKEWLHKVSIFGIEPLCLNHDNDALSEIGNRSKPSVSTYQKIKRESYRSSEWFLNQVQQLPLNIKIRLGLFNIEQNS